MHKIWVTVPVENQLQQLCDPSYQLIPNVDEISTEFCPGNISLLQEVCQLYFFFLFEGLATRPCGVKLRREGKEDNHTNRHSNLMMMMMMMFVVLSHLAPKLLRVCPVLGDARKL